MSNARSIAIVLTLAALCTGGRADAHTRPERRCQLAVSRGGASLFIGWLDALAKCRARASARVRRFVAARLRLLQQCKQEPPAALTPGSGCQTEPRTAGRITALAA